VGRGDTKQHINWSEGLYAGTVVQLRFVGDCFYLDGGYNNSQHAATYTKSLTLYCARCKQTCHVCFAIDGISTYVRTGRIRQLENETKPAAGRVRWACLVSTVTSAESQQV
jgi:hypothetical protein